MENMRIFEHPNSLSVRVSNRDGEWWFVAADICKGLGLGSTAAVVKRLEDSDHQALPVQTRGGIQKLQAVNSTGLMNMVEGSRKGNKQAFKDWMTDCVLPALELDWQSMQQRNTISTAMDTTIYNSGDLGNVRVVTSEDNPWFVAADVCAALGITDTSQAMDRIDDDDKVVRRIRIANNTLSMWCVNEAGLYALIMESTKPEAKKFKHWITHDVLPSIRKHGMYMTPELTKQALDDPDTLFSLAEKMKASRGYQDAPIVTSQQSVSTDDATNSSNDWWRFALEYPREAGEQLMMLAQEQEQLKFYALDQ